MAQLKDSLITGSLRVTDTIFSNTTMAGNLTCNSSLTILPENTTNEGGQICLNADPNHSAYNAYLDVYDNQFRIHSNGEVNFKVNLSSGNTTVRGIITGNSTAGTITSDETGAVLLCPAQSQKTGIFNGNGDGPGDSNNVANLIIKSWYGVGFVDGCTGNGMTVGINCRNGDIRTNGSLYIGKAATSGTGIYWNSYVESATDGSDASAIYQIKSGVAGGTELRISQANDNADVINICSPKYIYMNSKVAFDISDSWLRINESSSFSSGVYFGAGTGGLVRTDNQFQVGSGGSAFYANNTGHIYVNSTLSVGIDSTVYNLYVNGTGRFDNQVLISNYSADRGDAYSGSIQLREYRYQTTSCTENWYNAPGVTFHWGGRYVSKLGMYKSLLRIDSIPILTTNTGHPRYHVGSTASNSYILITINPETSWMLNFTLKLYQSYVATDIQISGYNYGSNHWYSPQAVILGSTSTGKIKIYFGYTANWKLWVAVDGGNYNGADVVNVCNGYTQIDGENAFTLTKVDSLPGTLQTTVEAYRPWYRDETVSNATTAASCTGNAATATTAASCTGNAATATDADTVDSKHASSFFTHDQVDASTTAGQDGLWGSTGSRSYHNVLPDGLSGVYPYGQVISFSTNDSARLQIYAPHRGSDNQSIYFRTGWGDDKKAWRTIIHSGNIGSQSVNYAASAGSATNADTVDNKHASDFRASLAPAAAEWFRGTPLIGSDGVMEIGRYVDFHVTHTSAADYDFRFDCDGNGQLKCTGKLYGAVWNDYAEFRQGTTTTPGRVVIEQTSGIMTICNERLAAGAKIISDTYGFAIGKTSKYQTPIAVSGRVLAYPYRNRNEYTLGAAVCAAPNGTIDIMTREEIMTYPERIIGTVSEIPTYEIWQGGDENHPNTIKVDGRIWIYVR